MPQTAKNQNSQGMSAQSGLQRAIQVMGGDENQNSNRGQKDVIIRRNSSKLLRPSSGQKIKDDAKKETNTQSSAASGHYRNKSQVVKKNMIANKVISQGIDHSNPPFTGVGSPQGRDPVLIMYNQNQVQSKNPKSLIMTDSTHANSQSDAANGFNSLAQKRLRSQQNYINNMNTQSALNAIAAGSVGSTTAVLDEAQRKEPLLQ